MGAHGTIGGSVTYQGNDRIKIARKKPVLPYSLTLGQQYQRWLYEDYASLWHEQSQATKQEHREAGSRFHLTGYQHWMKAQLSALPDLSGLWYLDSLSGGLTPDISRNLNAGTVIGATQAQGVIAGAFSFDGVNDRIQAGNDPSLQVDYPLTIEAFVRLDPAWAGYGGLFSRRDAASNVQFTMTDVRKLYFSFWTGGVEKASGTGMTTFDTGTWYHVSVTYDGHNIHLYVNGSLDRDTPRAGHIDKTSTGTSLGAVTSGGFQSFFGLIDHLTVYSRALSEQTLINHSKRRFSL